MIENIKTYNILISGKVHGVGFRYFSVSLADKYNIRGYVKNTSDSKVEIICQGDEEELDCFLEDIRKGPAFSVITGIIVEDVPENKIYKCSEIKY